MKRFIVLLSLVALLFSCSKDPITVDNGGDQNEPGFYASLSTPDFSKVATRAADENAIKDLYVAQFVDNVLVFFEKYEDINFTHKLNIPLKGASESDVVYFLANIKAASGISPNPMDQAEIEVGVTTLARFQRFELPVFYPKTIENFFPMRGVYTGKIVEGAVTNVDIVLKRMVAKLNFTFDSSPFADFTPTSVQLCHVPVSMALAPKAIAVLGEVNPAGFVGYPLIRGGNSHITLEPEVAAGVGGTFSWIIAENVRGSWADITTNIQKNPNATSNDPNYVSAAAEKGFYTEGQYSTYIHLIGETSTGSVRYSIYLGSNEKGDMNLLGNVEYNITTRILGVNAVDTRINYEDAVEILPESNSYIVNAGVRKELHIPTSRVANGIAALNAIESPATPLTFDNTDYKVDVVWQSWGATDALLTFDATQPDFFKVIVPSTVKNGNNAVIAVKNSVGEILWSWHLWFTDYNPERKNERFISAYFDDGTVMMDRNLGATWTEADGASIAKSMSTLGGTDTRALKAYGLRYQWGRKDAFANTTSPEGDYKPTLIPMYDGTGALIDDGANGGHTWIDLTERDERMIVEATQNPSNIYFFGKRNDWSVGSKSTEELNRELWDAGYQNPTDMKKSIFDPCPSGWRVPFLGDIAIECPWAGFHNGDPTEIGGINIPGNGEGVFEWYSYGATPGWEAISGGRLFDLKGYTGWFPAAGFYGTYQPPWDMGLNEVGVTGFYWGRNALYIPGDGVDDGKMFMFFTDEMFPSAMNYRQSAASIRCESTI